MQLKQMQEKRDVMFETIKANHFHSVILNVSNEIKGGRIIAGASGRTIAVAQFLCYAIICDQFERQFFSKLV